MNPTSKIKLPFNLKADLTVSQYKRADGSHSTGRTIDLVSYLPPNFSYFDRISLYVNNYLVLFAHMLYGTLRINVSMSCLHYHFQADSGTWITGSENYINENGLCVKDGEMYQIDMMKSGAMLKFSWLLQYTIRNFYFGLLNYTNSNWRKFDAADEDKRFPYKNETFVWFDPEMISEAELSSVLRAFSDSPLSQAIAQVANTSPEKTDKALGGFGLGLGIVAVLAALILIKD